jgi:hypothetical protein
MTVETMDQKTLAGMIEAGVVCSVQVVGQSGGWGVRVCDGRTERSLATRRGHVRMWRSFETLATYLRALGIVRFEVSVAEYDPVAPRARAAPSRVEQKAAHADFAYNAWFRTTVRAAIQAADTPGGVKVAHDAVAAALRSGDAAALRALAEAGARRPVQPAGPSR